ncbi:unnamed protein product [Adineta ricciae]|uniref:Uncharacterized protein n=1 Tax=Adineta ricciae TaxID=249248 RepID=A0A815VZE4_ADIRI|nr:unnamed protein product [Adineta ricciae]
MTLTQEFQQSNDLFVIAIDPNIDFYSSLSKLPRLIPIIAAKFPTEGTHGVWPEYLIRRDGRCGFKAKFGKEWFECRVENEGTKKECETAQESLEIEKPTSAGNKQWSSAETELSDNDDSSIESGGDEKQNCEMIDTASKMKHNNNTKTSSGKAVDDSSDDEAVLMEEINKSISKKRDHHFNAGSKAKKLKTGVIVESCNEEVSSSSPLTNASVLLNIQSDLSEVRNEVIELKKMVLKLYASHKRSLNINKHNDPVPSTSESLIVNGINLLTLSGTTASRYMLAAARVVLTQEQYENGYLPDFRGDKENRVEIEQDRVDKLREAVQKKFGYKTEDMDSIWNNIRTSLVQKVSDVRKSKKRVSQKQQQQDYTSPSNNDINPGSVVSNSQIEMSHKSAQDILNENLRRRRKKTNQQAVRRLAVKRKRSLVSLLSASSISSNCLDQDTSEQTANDEKPKSYENESFTAMSSSLFCNTFDDEGLNLLSDNKNDFGVDGSSSSSPNNSSDSSSDPDELDMINITNSNFSDHRPLHSCATTTVSDFAVDILQFCRISHLPDKQRTELLKIFYKYIPSPNLVPKSSDDLLEAVGITKLYTLEKLCGACYQFSKNGVCSTRNCVHESMRIPSDDMVEIITFDLAEQLKFLVNNNLDILQEYQNQARLRTTFDSCDIVRGEVYQSILGNHAEFFISVMIHSDGIPLYKSKNCNAWPILGAVLELPPFARSRADNTLLLAIWVGKQKPNFNLIFEKLSTPICDLKHRGIQTNHNRTIKVLFPILMGDMPALSSMVKFVEPNAYYACMFCNTKGIYSNDGHCVTYPFDDEAELRTNEKLEECAHLAASMFTRLDRERTKGFKGVSAFSKILDVPLPYSVVIDPMHTVFLCHSKKFLIQLQNFISKENMLKINAKLRSINYIHDILRRPRSFSNVQKWKASEIRLFILYIGLPVLAEFLPEERLGELAFYNAILRLLHDHWESDKQLHQSTSLLLKLYVKHLSKLVNSGIYSSSLLTISTHTHLHLPFQCVKFGRLNWLTNFVFESFLGFLKAFVKGSSGAGNQIAFAFISNYFLEKTNGNTKSRFGHFSINDETYSSNVLTIEFGKSITEFLTANGHVSATTVYFSRVHHLNVTYHSFLYSRKGSTCSYLISYEKNNALLYGYILFFCLTDGQCSAVIQKLTQVDFSLTSCFSSFKYLTAIKGFIDNVYIFVKRVEPSLVQPDLFDFCSVSSLRCRCLCVTFHDDLMILTNYSFAYEHN